MEKKKILGLVGGSAAAGYLLRDKIGSLAAYLIDKFVPHGYYETSSNFPYLPGLDENEVANAFNYWSEKLYPINAKLMHDVLFTLGLMTAFTLTFALTGYLIEKKLNGD